MAQQRKRIKHKATFEERLAEEAIKFKAAAEKATSRQHCEGTAVAASPAGRDGRPHERRWMPWVAATGVTFDYRYFSHRPSSFLAQPCELGRLSQPVQLRR
jgi:hypothetical protein